MKISKALTIRLMPIISLLSLASIASAGVIITSVSPASPVTIGSTFTVTFSMSGYTGTDEIDGYNFNIAYDTGLFSFVAGSGAIHDGAAFGADANWLRSAPQDGVGAGALPLTDSTLTPPTTLAGVINVSVVDLRGASTRGTTAASGFLYSFDLKADSIGTGSITPSAFGDGTTLFDVSLSPVGSTSFTGTSVTVVPEPTQCCLALAAGVMLAMRRLRRR